MIFENFSIKPSLFFNTKGSAPRFEQGSIVRVEILSRLPSKNQSYHYFFTARVQSTVIHVKSSQNLDIGQVFNAKVIIKNNEIGFQPLKEINSGSQSIFSQLEIPETPFTQHALHLYTQSTLQLNPHSILNLVILAKSILSTDPHIHERTSDGTFKNLSVKEKNALFAAFLLQQKTTNFSEDAIQAVMNALEGKKNKESILNLLNQIKTTEKHWFIVPYEKIVDGIAIKGSVRVLINLTKNEMIKTEVYASTEKQDWLFEIEDKLCEVQVYKQIPLNFEKLILYLKDSLANFGIDVIKKKEEKDVSKWKQVDVAL